MAEKYTITTEYPGYASKPELTNINPAYLGAGSINTVIDWSGIIGSRAGYRLLGEAGVAGQGIKGSKDWDSSKGIYHVLRKNGTTLEFLYNDKWYPAKTGLPAGQMSAMPIFDNTLKQDVMIMVFGDNNIYDWTGGFATIKTNTATSITMEQTGTFGGRGFPVTGTLVINGSEFPYTGGAATDTLTGLTGLATYPVGTMVTVKVNTTAAPSPQFPVGYTCDVVGVHKNQLYVGSFTSRVVLVSKATNYKDYTMSTPRAVGDGNAITLDDICMGFESGENSMTIFGRSDDIYTISFQLTGTTTSPTETFEIKKLKTAKRQGLISPNAKVSIKNAIAYITREPTLDTVGSIDNVDSTQNVPISDIIKNDFDVYDLTDSCLTYWKRSIVSSIPKSRYVLLFDLQRKLWQPPQDFGVRIGSLSISKEGDLIGHSYDKNESYILFTGTSDNGKAINSVAEFVYNNFNARYNRKTLTEYVQDGYITANGKLKRTLMYDYRGQFGISEKIIDGGNSKYTYYVETNSGFGQAHIGERTLSGGSLTPPDEIRRFRVIMLDKNTPFFEIKVRYEMADIPNGAWKLVAHGSNVSISGLLNNDIKI